MNIFLDTSIVNRILDLEESHSDSKWEQDHKYLRKLLNGPVENGTMIFFVNPTILWQINNTPNSQRRIDLIHIANQFKFTDFSMAIFPISFPVEFPSDEQSDEILKICAQYPCLIKDQKILADAAYNEKIDVLLTTDRELAKVVSIGKISIMLPRDLYNITKENKHKDND